MNKIPSVVGEGPIEDINTVYKERDDYRQAVRELVEGLEESVRQVAYMHDLLDSVQGTSSGNAYINKTRALIAKHSEQK